MHLPDLAAAVAAASEGDALWLAGDPSALAGQPGLLHIPFAVVDDPASVVTTTTLACLRPGPWARLFAALAQRNPAHL